jgi:TolB protein
MPSEYLRLPAELVLSLALAGVAAAGQAETLVHESSLGGLSEIWRSAAGTPNAGRFLAKGIAAFGPAVAADGSLAFMRPDQDGRQAIWFAAPGGAGLRRVSPGGVDDRMPAFSPDGRRIAFVRMLPSGASEIRVVARYGQRTAVIRTAPSGVQHLSPAWAPDGRRIAFASNVDGHFRIWLMGADGGGALPVTAAGATDLEPAWSPDGRRLVFVRQFSDGASDLVIRDLATAVETRLSLPGEERRPSWGPFSDRIAFASDADGDMEIYSIDPDGTGLRQWTANTVSDLAPAWLPRR